MSWTEYWLVCIGEYSGTKEGILKEDNEKGFIEEVIFELYPEGKNRILIVGWPWENMDREGINWSSYFSFQKLFCKTVSFNWMSILSELLIFS